MGTLGREKKSSDEGHANLRKKVVFPMSEFLAKSKVVKIALVGFVSGMSLFTLAAMIYIPFHYAAVMPRSPQPETGRIYPIKAQYEVVVYVNKQELDRRDFVKYDLTTVTAVSGLLLFFLGNRSRWFKRHTTSGANPQSGNRE